MIGSAQKLLMGVAGVPSGGPWDIGSASYSGVSLSVSAQEGNPQDLFFKPDGAKLYIIGVGTDSVNEYNLSPAWDISSASHVQSFSVSSQESLPTGLFFKPDGLKMYVAGQGGDEVNEYDLSSAWDISTAVFVQRFDVDNEDTTPRGLSFKDDGTKMYIIGTGSDGIHEYSLSSAWNISTAAFTQTFSVSAQMTDPAGLFIKDDGSRLYTVSGGNVDQYEVSTPWDIRTASYTKRFSVSSQTTTGSGVFFKPDGTMMFVNGLATVYEYDVG